jgi:adenylylsulfate reductase, subunit A
VDAAVVADLKAKILAPLDRYKEFCNFTTEPSINPNYILWRSFMDRMQKIMDEYAGGVTAGFKTSKPNLERAMELFVYLQEDAEKLAAEDIYSLERCWENMHRMAQAEAHVRTMLFRDETRWPGYYFRSDTPKMDDKNWHCFANCRRDAATGEWEMFKKDVWTLPGA